MTRRLLRRLPRTLVLAVLIGYLAYTLLSWFIAWEPADGGAYYDAAARLAAGGPLYPPMNPEAHEVYRYAPWFAAAWIPLTTLPRDLALHAWSIAMLVCAFMAVIPLLRQPSWAALALAVLTAQVLAETAMFGNGHPLVVAVLTWTASRRSFPFWVGVAASIKLVPLAFALVWAGRREWRPVAVALATSALLFAPMLLFDLSNYVTDPGTGLLSLYAVSPIAWGLVALCAAGATVWLAYRRSEWAWIAAGVLMAVGPPRVVTSYLAFVVVGYLRMRRHSRSAT